MVFRMLVPNFFPTVWNWVNPKSSNCTFKLAVRWIKSTSFEYTPSAETSTFRPLSKISPIKALFSSLILSGILFNASAKLAYALTASDCNASELLALMHSAEPNANTNFFMTPSGSRWSNWHWNLLTIMVRIII